MSESLKPIPLVDQTGSVQEIDPSDAADLIQGGFTQPNPQQLQDYQNQRLNESLPEQAKGFGEGAASALSLGASTGLERMAGVKSEDIQRRRETTGHTLGTVAGLVVPALLGQAEFAAPGLMEDAGSAVAGMLPKATGILSAGARGVANQATQMAIFQGGDELSKMLSDDPNQTLASAVANIKMSGLVGGVIGGGFGAGAQGIKSLANTTGLGNLIADFKGKLFDAINNPNPTESVTKELQDYYTSTKSAADEIYGANGIKAQDIGKVMKAFFEYLPTLKDFEKRFTTELNGDKVIDPSKVNTYMNQIGKPSAEIKQSMLKNFLDKSEKYRNTIADSHANLGIDSPIEPSSLHATYRTLDEVTPGAKLAQIVIDKGLAKFSGEALGAGVGGLAGSLIGHPVLGAVVGGHVGDTFLSSVIPSLTKPILEKIANAEGFTAASQLGMAAAKGQQLIMKTADAVLKTGEASHLESLQPSMADKKKLQDWVDKGNNDPQSVMGIGSELGHYMPGHAGALAQKAGIVQNYLSQQKPMPFKSGILGKSIPPSKQQETAYDRTLGIAEQPLSVCKLVKNGQLTVKDIMDLNSMHPDVYNLLKQQFTNSLINHVSDENSVPYKTRQSISMFLGQPLDGTMTQPAIATIQSVFVPPPPPNMPQKGAKGSTKALDKTSDMYRTPGQQREERASKGQ